jgi:hypothetical protein
VFEVAEIIDLTPAQRVARSAQIGAKATWSFLTRAAKDAPSNAKAAAAFVAEASKELAEIAKEKGPGLAESAALAARVKLGKVLPFVKPEAKSEPVVAAAE